MTKREERSMETAICTEVADLRQRGVNEEKAREMYGKYDAWYRESVEKKTRNGSAYFYIIREAYARYLVEDFGAEEMRSGADR